MTAKTYPDSIAAFTVCGSRPRPGYALDLVYEDTDKCIRFLCQLVNPIEDAPHKSTAFSKPFAEEVSAVDFEELCGGEMSAEAYCELLS